MASLRYADSLLHKASRKAVAVGLNYLDHAKEMASIPDRAAPFWFFKPSTSYLRQGAGPIYLPPGAIVHHEVELGVVIGLPASRVSAANAHHHIAGYVCAIDLTARNWQADAKAMGRPWSLAKGCDTFLPLSSVIPAASIPLDANGVADVTLYLDVNGKRRQHCSTRHMLCPIPQLIEHISANVTLEEWDIILTGTPSGVGQICHGDSINAGIEGLIDMNFTAVHRD